MTILRTHNHEGTAGNTATQIGEGYDGQTGAGTAPTYVAQALVGATSIQFPGTGAAYLFETNSAGSWNRFSIRLPAIPAATITFCRKRTSGGTTLLANLAILTNRTVRMQSGSNTTVDTSVAVLATGTWYQVIWNVSGSTQTASIYDASGNLVETLTGAAVAGAVGQVQIGQNTASGSALYIDQHVIADADPGPIVPPPPTSPGVAGDGLDLSMNRIAGTSGLSATEAANVYAGTSGLSLVGALNAAAGNTGLNQRSLAGVLNQLAGTTSLEIQEAASRIEA